MTTPDWIFLFSYLAGTVAVGVVCGAPGEDLEGPVHRRRKIPLVAERAERVIDSNFVKMMI